MDVKEKLQQLNKDEKMLLELKQRVVIPPRFVTNE